MLKFVISLLIVSLGSLADPTEGWELFSKVKFSGKELGGEMFLVPLFDSKIRSWEGKEVYLQGYFIPMDGLDKKTVIISKVPNSSCFFCGSAGPETIAEVQLKEKPGRLKADQRIEVRGILVLNETDVDHMNFILRDAELQLLK